MGSSGGRTKRPIALQKHQFAIANVEPGSVQHQLSGRYTLRDPGKCHQVGERNFNNLVFAALLPCALIGFRKRRGMIRAFFIITLALSLGIAVQVPIACGTTVSGGGKTTTPPPPPQGATTPSGVYTLNVTASIPGLQRSVPVTVTVQ